MPRRIAYTTEHHAPGDVGDATRQLAVDEVTQAPGAQAGGHERREEIHQAQIVDAVFPGDEPHRRHHAEQPAMERHTALPDEEDFERVRKVVRRLVEQYITQAAA